MKIRWNETWKKIWFVCYIYEQTRAQQSHNSYVWSFWFKYFFRSIRNIVLSNGTFCKKKHIKSQLSSYMWNALFGHKNHKMNVKLMHCSVLVLLLALSGCLSESACEHGRKSDNATIIHRSKRYLDFIPLSRMFVCITSQVCVEILIFGLLRI